MILRLPVIPFAFAALCGIGSTFAQENKHVADAAGFEKIVRPFVEKHCLECHGPDKQKGKLRLDTLSIDFSKPLAAEKWGEVVNALNGHEMPPEDEPQPSPGEAGALVEWLTAELGRAEISKRSSRVVLRRMNRQEYNHTIRDLLAVDYQPADSFPEDPPSGGFDNIGQALTISPLQVELYYTAAREALDRALVEGDRPPSIKWHIEPEDDKEGSDRTRVKIDGQNILLNKGENPAQNGFTVVHHDAWNKGINFRDFTVPVEGEYIIRFRAAGRTPNRSKVVESARKFLNLQRDEQNAREPEKKADHQRMVDDQIRHFETARTYDYGAPRIRVGQSLGGRPIPLLEMDIAAPESAPEIYEVRAHFSAENAAVQFNQAYEVTRSLENWQFTGKDEFERPTLLIDWIELEGPIYPSWPPPSHRLVMGDSRNHDDKIQAREILARFMARAYRRPVLPGEVAAKVALFEKLRPEKPSFVEAIKVPLAAVLASPHFLYLVEPEAPAAQPTTLNAFELASRLSYFLWSSMPDEELFRLASSGELLKPEVLRAQAKRMTADPKSDALVKNFAGQWLGLRKVGANPPAKTLYPEYDRHLEISIVRETEGFFAEILRSDLDVRNFLKSNFVTINERLARFYGIPGVKGDEIRRVPVPPDSNRGGLVTQASFQSITSNGTRTSPVLRGVWVLKTLLGYDPGLPVANVGEIANSIPGIDKATVRQRLQIHRESPSCARCHDRIDPLGLALENYNAAGGWREREGHGYQGRIEENDPIIDTSAKMPDGTAFVGVEGLQAQLLKQQDAFLTSLSNQLHTYALGRELGFSDRPAIQESVKAMKAQGHTLRSLIVHIVTSPTFTTK